MTYNAMAALSEDPDLKKRLMACAAEQGIENPWGWAEMRTWKFATQPGWADAYGQAMGLGQTPGKSETVITDADILTAVLLLKEEPAPEEVI